MVKKDKRFLFALLFIVLSAVAARLVVGLLYFNALTPIGTEIGQ